jgi:hypothetical protein
MSCCHGGQKNASCCEKSKSNLLDAYRMAGLPWQGVDTRGNGAHACIRILETLRARVCMVECMPSTASGYAHLGCAGMV